MYACCYKQNVNTKKDIFKNWVEHVLQLPEYYDLFVKNGVETLEVASMLRANQLSVIGITKVGHVMQISSAAAALKKQCAPAYAQTVEGGST